MKRQPYTQAAPINNFIKFSFTVLIIMSAFLSCIDWDDLGGGGPPIVDNCSLDPVLFNGTYLASDICNANWESTDYEINVVFANSYDNCEWAIQNILNKGISVSGISEGSTSVLKIYPQNFVEYWQISGDLTRKGNEIKIDLTLTSNILDSTVACSITGIKK